MRHLMGRGWILFDLLYMVTAVLIIAIVSSAAGEIAQATLAVLEVMGVAVIIALVGVVEFYGRRVSEKFMTAGTVMLYAGFLMCGLTVLSGRWGTVQDLFTRGTPPSYPAPPPAQPFSPASCTWAAIWRCYRPPFSPWTTSAAGPTPWAPVS